MTQAVRHEALAARAEWRAALPATIGITLGLDRAIQNVLLRIERTLPQFLTSFPAPSSDNGWYAGIANDEWTNGFWTGMLWLAHELTGSARYRDAAAGHLPSFVERINRRVAVDHHDLGFLYTLSTCAAYRLTGDESARAAGLSAADALLQRFDARAGVIQAWGDLSDPLQRGRIIIDCNLNLPLLWWATAQTGDQSYRFAANCHVARAAELLVRADGSTFHTYYVDTETGAPRHGSTHQGASDESCWARGQTWGIYGFALAYRHTGQAKYLDLATRLANYFLNRLPADLVCCWDLIYVEETTLRDSSAAAIAACGLLETAGALPISHPDRAAYGRAALRIVEALDRGYLAPLEGGNGVLVHAVYNLPRGMGIDESCIWGDYFYLEALMRMRRIWNPYWYL